MPDPGTTDTVHILAIVKESRTAVLWSVITQIISSVLYIVSLFLLAQVSFRQSKLTLAGIILSAIGVLGLCADAFFHLLAFFMTDNNITIQKDVVGVMSFMQTTGVAFLLPLLLPFFIGSLVLSEGLKKQDIISKKASRLFYIALVGGMIAAIISNAVFSYTGPVLSLSILGLFALAQSRIGFELISSYKKKQAWILRERINNQLLEVYW
jgi:hypothetical protein